MSNPIQGFVNAMSPPQQPNRSDEPDGLLKGVEVLKKLETDIGIPVEVAVTSIAISLKRIADGIVQLEKTIETGNIGQGSNLKEMHSIRRALESITSAISTASQADRSSKIDALQRVISDVIARG